MRDMAVQEQAIDFTPKVAVARYLQRAVKIALHIKRIRFRFFNVFQQPHEHHYQRRPQAQPLPTPSDLHPFPLAHAEPDEQIECHQSDRHPDPRLQSLPTTGTAGITPIHRHFQCPIQAQTGQHHPGQAGPEITPLGCRPAKPPFPRNVPGHAPTKEQWKPSEREFGRQRIFNRAQQRHADHRPAKSQQATHVPFAQRPRLPIHTLH